MLLKYIDIIEGYMLPDWPEQKRELQHLFERIVQRQTFAGAKVVAAIPHVVVSEGDRLVYVSADGARNEVEFVAHEASSEFDRSVVAKGDVQPVLDAIESLSGTMAKNVKTEMLEIIREASENHGAVFRGTTGKEMTDEFIRALEAIDCGFEDDGSPSLVEIQRRVDSIMEKKRNEWLLRESYRRLAD